MTALTLVCHGDLDDVWVQHVVTMKLDSFS